MSDEQQRPPEAPEPGESEADTTSEEQAAEEPATVTLARHDYLELRALAEERDDYLRRLQRAVADYQNYQKRVEKSKDVLRLSAVASVAEGILPVADSLARARTAAEQTEGCAQIVSGIKLVEKELYAALERLGIRPIAALGEPFDPHFHDAIMQQRVPGAEPRTVVAEVKKGFVLGDQVVRAAQVVVAAPPETEATPETASEEGEE